MESKSRSSSLKRKHQVLSNIKAIDSNTNLALGFFPRPVMFCSVACGNFSKVNTELERIKALIL